MIRKTIKIILQFLFIIILGLALLIFWVSYGTFSYQIFNKDTWLEPPTNKTDSTCYRGGMAMFIQTILLKKGMSKTEVMALLGKPDSDQPSQIEYTLGMCSGIGLDYDGLIIEFDSDDKISNSSIVQH